MSSSSAPCDVAALMRAALEHHAGGRPAEAQNLYRQVLALDPGHPQAPRMLALLLADGPDAEAAEEALSRQLTLRPDDGAILHALGRLTLRQGLDAQAADVLSRAAMVLPGLAPVHNDLGVALQRLGRPLEALASLDRAVALDPAYAVAHGNRGFVLFDMGRFTEAMDAQLQALARAPPDAAADRANILQTLSRAARKAGRREVAEWALRTEMQAGRDDPATVDRLAALLEESGRPDEARTLRDALARRIGLARAGRLQGAAATILVLAGTAGGLAPIRYLIDPETFAILSLSLLSADQPDAPLGGVDPAALAGADVVFSALADVDHDDGQFEAVSALCARLGKPVLNPPRAVRRTGRDHASVLFAGIPDMVTPKVRYADTADIAAQPLKQPTLVRPVGDHGGDNLVLLRTEADKAAFLSVAGSDRFLVSPFHDFQSPDGYWRKYRLIFIDRRVHPYHLAIHDDWLVHYWRAEMQRAPWKMTEEARFLEDWRGVFGARAAAAVEEAARRLDLDYGGMDCALTADGQVLLFEANACFLLHLDEPAAAFPYKHRHVPPIRDAFTRMALERAGRPAAV